MTKKRIEKWEPKLFELESGTVWSFPDRGDWATHDGAYRGNWSPYIARNLILRYSMQQDLILDQFVGGGTTLIGAKLLNRNSIGVDVNPEALIRCSEKCKFQYDNDGKVFIDAGFKLKEIIIKEQHNCKSTSFWKTKSEKYNFLLLSHEYLFVFEKR